MSKVQDKIALVVGLQVAEGTINADVRDSTIIANIDDGSPLDTGEALGILFVLASLTLDFDRIEEAGEDYPGTFSRSPGDFVRVDVPAFSFETVLKGGGKPLDGTPSAGDYDLPEAIVALLAGFGLVEGVSGTASTTYVLDEPESITFKAWRGATSYVIQDCKVSDIEYALDPSGAVRIKWTIAPGSVIRRATDAFPTSIAFGLQKSTPAPILERAGATIGATTRGFLTGKLKLSNAFTAFPDSNAIGGLAQEQEGRAVTFEGDWYVDSGNLNQDFADLSKVSGYEDIAFTVGQHVVSGVANAVGFSLRNFVFEQMKNTQDAGRVVYGIKGYATNDGSGNDELLLTSA